MSVNFKEAYAEAQRAATMLESLIAKERRDAPDGLSDEAFIRIGKATNVWADAWALAKELAQNSPTQVELLEESRPSLNGRHRQIRRVV